MFQKLRSVNHGGRWARVRQSSDTLRDKPTRLRVMSWPTTSTRRRPLLWEMNEPELTAGTEAYGGREIMQGGVMGLKS